MSVWATLIINEEFFMAKTRTSIKKPRTFAFLHQKGCCYYCNQPMWANNPSGFASQYKISLGQTKSLQCTAEHLIAHHQGGSTTRKNIVAACLFCNSKRHARKEAPSPKDYKKFVKSRLSQVKWHGLKLH